MRSRADHPQAPATCTDTAAGKLLATYGTANPDDPNAFPDLQTQGNLVIYDDFADPTAALWSTNAIGENGAFIQLWTCNKADE